MSEKEINIKFGLNDNASPKIKQIAKNLGLTDAQAKTLQRSFKQMNKEISQGFKTAMKSVAIGLGAVTTATVVTLNKTREYADRVDDMSKKIGISKKAFQEWEYIIKQNGADIDVVQRGMKTLVEQSIKASEGNKESSKTFKTLGVSVKDTNGNLKNQEQLFNEVIAKLQQMPKGLERSAIASRLLGRAGVELQPLLEENAKSIEAVKKEAYDLGLILDDKTIDSANTFSDNISAIQRGLGAMMMSLGNDLIPTLNETCRLIISNMPQIRATVVPVIQSVAGVIKFVIEHLKGLTIATTTVLGVMAGYKTIMTTIAVLSTLQKVLHAGKIAWVAYGVASKLALAGPFLIVGGVIAGVIGTVIALENRFKLVTKAVQKFKDVAKGIGERFAKNGKTDVQNSTSEITAKYASGTSYAKGGLSLVGERGPELINLPTGSRVLNNGETSKHLGANIVLNLNIAGNVIGNREFINQIEQVLGRKLAVALNC